MPNFETFNRKSASKTKTPMITLQKGGNISMNLSSAELFREPGDPEQLTQVPVELLWDADEKIVGIRRQEETTPNVYFLRKQTNSDTYIVSGRAFAKHYDLDVSEAKRFKTQKWGDVVGFSLADDFAPVSRDRTSEDEED